MLRELTAVARDSIARAPVLIGDSMRNTLTILLSVLAYLGASSYASAQEQHANMSPKPQGELQIEIQSPGANFTADQGETSATGRPIIVDQLHRVPRGDVIESGKYLFP